MTVVLLILALVVILASAELFTNAVEWFGRRYDLGEGAVGSVLAAVGTALPETLLPIIAIVFTGAATPDANRHRSHPRRAVHAQQPGHVRDRRRRHRSSAWRGRRSLEVTVNETVMRRDLSHFLIAYALVMVASFIHVRALHYGARRRC